MSLYHIVQFVHTRQLSIVQSCVDATLQLRSRLRRSDGVAYDRVLRGVEQRVSANLAMVSQREQSICEKVRSALVSEVVLLRLVDVV